ncbi:MAG: protein translocase subunit SecD [Planctomycetota bacterium]|nr:protein translocase subunit SecD [Planctomycetota bacterium]
MEQINVRGRAVIILIVTVLLALSVQQSGIKLGQDLQGGTILRFSLDIDAAIKSGRIESTIDREQFVADTIRVIDDRINKFGLAETTLTQVGENKFEISLPAGSEGETEGIVGVVTSLGDLAFRIQVLPEQNNHENKKRDSAWPGTPDEFNKWKEKEFQRKLELEAAGKIYGPATLMGEPDAEPFYLVVREGTTGTELQDYEVCEVPIERHRFDGRILTNPRVARDDRGGAPVVVFDVKTEFQNVFGEWTGLNIGLPMAIILNEEFTGDGRAPTIQSQLTDSVQITLGSLSFSDAKKRAEELTTVLQTGSLKIRPVLESKNRIGASLAGESRDRGVLAVIVAFALVLIFMVVYYRQAGLVANVALLLNLVLLVGFLALFQAVLTLPGIAGIVLTVGMAVDANILINERIREERRLGRSVRRALHEGYAKALSAIIDANVTSLITAAFLFKFGSGPIRGFAVTLAIGLIVSMFTAIYVTRTIFEWRVGSGGMQKLGTHGNPNPPSVNWVGLRRFFAPISVIGVIFGLFMFSVTDKYTLYDVDFTGGYKLQARFLEPTTPDQVRKALGAGETKKIEVTVRDFNENDELATRQIELDVGPYRNVETLAVGDEGTTVEVKVQRLFEEGAEGVREADQAAAFEQYVLDLFRAQLVPNWTVEGPERYTAPEDLPEGSELAEFGGGIFARIAFSDTKGLLTAETLEELLVSEFPYYTLKGSERTRNDPVNTAGFSRKVKVEPATDAKAVQGLSKFDIWIKSTHSERTVESDPDRMRQYLGEYLGGKLFRASLGEKLGTVTEADLAAIGLSEPFPSQDQIGSTVAERLRQDAMIALFFSLVGIIVYIAIRFKSRAMGFAAVLCLFHDVAITLGLVSVANTLGIVDAKINLAMVAAFLTLVGYSVNDTVVVFDRIREERGKRPTIPTSIINLAINMTLARTIRTSLTFLIVCVTLFGFNFGQRNVLEGFSFLLILGSFIGTYSTIAISSPLLLYLPWLWERIQSFAPKGKIVSEAAQNAAMLIFVPVLAVLWAVWALAFAVGALITGIALFVPWAMSDDAETGAAGAAA